MADDETGNLLVKLSYGGIMWDKPTGTLRVSGLALPTSEEPSLGDEVDVTLYGVPVDTYVVVTGWICTPNGFQFSGEKNYSPDIYGRVLTQFSCRSLYLQELGVDPLKDLGFDPDVVHEVESPWPTHRDNYYMLDEAMRDLAVPPAKLSGSRDLSNVIWSIPSVANTPVTGMDIQGYAKAAPRVGSSINGANLLYFVDGFTNTVNKVNLSKTVIPPYGSISISPRFGETILVQGGRADPTADYRGKDAPNSRWAECKEITNVSNVYSPDFNSDDTDIIKVVDPITWENTLNTGKVYGIFVSNKVSPWSILASKQSVSWKRPWGPHRGGKPPEMPGRSASLVVLENFFGSLGWKYWYDRTKDMIERTYELYSIWFAATDHTKEQYHFVNLAEWSNPSIYQQPFIQEELNVDAHKNSFYEHVTEGGNCEQYQLNWEFKGLRERWHCEECGDDGKNPEPEVYTSDFMSLFSAGQKIDVTFLDPLDPAKRQQDYFQKKLKEPPQGKGSGCPATITVTHTVHKYTPICYGEVALKEADAPKVSPDVEKRPFLLRRNSTTETMYRCTPLALNFNSIFWQVEDEDTRGNPMAVDSSNQRIWISPYDSMEMFAQNMIAGKALRDLWCPGYDDSSQICPNPLSEDQRTALLGCFATLQGTFSHSTLFGWLADLIELEFDSSVVSQWQRYFDDRSNWGLKPIWTLINNAFSVSQARVTDHLNISTAVQVISETHPGIVEKINDAQPNFYSSLGLDKDGKPSVDVGPLTDPLYNVAAALDWIVKNGYALNRTCNPIPVNMTEIYYNKEGQTTVESNIITGEVKTSTRLVQNTHLTYLDPADIRCTTDMGGHGTNDAISKVSANVHDWGLIQAFEDQINVMRGKELYYINESVTRNDFNEGFTLAKQWKADKNVRSVRMNVNAKGVATVGRNYIALKREG